MSGYIATVEKGVLVYPKISEWRLKEELKLNEGKFYRTEKVKSKRSLEQNAYLWVCLDLISAHCGHSSEELHKLFKGLFLPPKILKFKGKEYKLAGSTTDLSVGEMVEYIMRIGAYVADMGITLPNPDEFKRGLDVVEFAHE